MTTDPQHPETSETQDSMSTSPEQPVASSNPEGSPDAVREEPVSEEASGRNPLEPTAMDPVPAETVPPETTVPELPLPTIMAAEEVVITETVMMTSEPSPVEPSPVEPAVAESAAAAAGLTTPESSESPAADTTASESSASRIREKMAASGIEQGTESESTSATSSQRSKSGSIEIPGTDELDASLESEIQAVMQQETVAAPAPVAAETGAAAADAPEPIGPGSKVKGIVQQIHGDDVFLDAGLRATVAVPLRQFPEDKQPTAGAQLEVIIDDMDADGLIRARMPRGRHKPAGNWDALAVEQIVDCMVTAVNKGGLQVTVSGLRGFMPASQVELGFAGNLDGYVGQKLTVQVTEVNPKKRNLVVSRRALLQAERAEGEGEFWSKAEVGQEYSGTVKTIKDYGAFVNIGVVDGFLHIGEISWSRINHPNEVLQEGQTIDVKVLKLDSEKKRISLGMKQLAQNPWTTAVEKYSSGRTVAGKVTRITDFGAFIELEPGLEGMVHISELAWRRVGSVAEILTAGETRDFQVQEVDPKRKRVSLSLKALEKRPEPTRQEQAEHPESAAPEEPRKPRNQNLRGGTDRNAARGGLFGNPSDFS